MTKKKIRPFGEILLDMEKLIDEAIDTHDVQDTDLLNWMYGHLIGHRPDARMEYLDGTFPEFYFGPSRDKK